jgi:hypothetical protein
LLLPAVDPSMEAAVPAVLLDHGCCRFVNSVTEQLTGTLSLGAAVFASVLFASGLNTEGDVVSE